MILVSFIRLSVQNSVRKKEFQFSIKIKGELKGHRKTTLSSPADVTFVTSKNGLLSCDFFVFSF